MLRYRNGAVNDFQWSLCQVWAIENPTLSKHLLEKKKAFAACRSCVAFWRGNQMRRCPKRITATILLSAHDLCTYETHFILRNSYLSSLIWHRPKQLIYSTKFRRLVFRLRVASTLEKSRYQNSRKSSHHEF